jgi:oxaloacetate decarboxylase alpha subunit
MNREKQGSQKLRITDTTLRDAHQSLWATRMRIDDIMGIIDAIDAVGYYSLEVWGGATFDVCLRFLREDPWERLRRIRERAKQTPLQMLLRGQNLVGYRNYSDDVVERFVALARENGMDIFRIFDALNDTRNIESAVRAVKKYGGHAQGTICYTISPVHTIDKFLQYASEQMDLGIDSICIKDMAGILSPVMAERLVGALTGRLKLPVQVHCHMSSGMAVATYLAAVRAGAGAIDCAISSMAGFSSQPPVETMVSIFEGTGYDSGLDVAVIESIEQHFAAIAPKRRQAAPPRSIIDPGILIHQIPGGMISNFRSQLDKQEALDKLPEVLGEVAAVRKDLGYPPLVTPTSQIVGTQAVMNVLSGERYSMVPNEVKNYVKGMYGRPPAPLDRDFTRMIIGDEDMITRRPADLLDPMLPDATKSIDPVLIEKEEDIISYCILPEPALEFFRWRRLSPDQRPPVPADEEMKKEEDLTRATQNTGQKESADEGIRPAELDGIREIIDRVARFDVHEVSVRKGKINVVLKFNGDNPAGEQYDPDEPLPAREAQAAVAVASPKPDKREEGEEPEIYGSTLNAPISGTFYAGPGPGEQPFVKVGDLVHKGETVCQIEAMKMLNEIYAETTCKIVRLLVQDGQGVSKGQPLIAVEEVSNEMKA